MNQVKKVRFQPSNELSIRDQWIAYSKAVFVNADPSVAQYMATRQAFYAGVISMLSMNLKIAELSEEEGIAKFEGLKKEGVSWFESMNGKGADL